MQSSRVAEHGEQQRLNAARQARRVVGHYERGVSSLFLPLSLPAEPLDAAAGDRGRTRQEGHLSFN